MLTERNAIEVQEKIIRFQGLGPDNDVLVRSLTGRRLKEGIVSYDFVLAFFPADENLTKIELGIYKSSEVTTVSKYYRRIFEMEFTPGKNENLSIGSIDELLEETKKSIESGMPLFTLSFGKYEGTEDEFVGIHTVKSIPAKFVFDTLQRYSSLQLFGTDFNF